MNNSSDPNWNLEEYNHICKRDKTDGEIFWNKVNVLIAVNFGLFGFFSLKDFSKDGVGFDLFIWRGIMGLGMSFSLFWLLVLCRQSEWIRHWKNRLLEMERDKKVNLEVQTKGDTFGDKMCCILNLGSFHRVGGILPAVFAALWAIALFRFWNGK